MKKILYIIPVLLLSILLVSNVYGYSVVDNNVYFDNFDEFFPYIESKGITLDRTIDKDFLNNLRSMILNSEEFSTYRSTYPYQFYLEGKVYLFDKKPTINIYCKTGSSPDISIQLEFESTNANYCILTSNSSGIVSAHEDDVGFTTKFLIYAEVGLKNNPSFYSRENLDFYIRGINFDFYYTGTEESIIKKSPEFSFIPTYSENYETCNLKVDIKNAPEYYTLEYAINSSTSTWYTFDNNNGITIENNCLVIVRMLDEHGDELFSNSLNITLLDNQLSSTYFKVDFDNPGAGHLNFTPIIYYNFQDTFDLYLSINSSKDVYFTSNSSDWYMYNDKDIISNLDYFKITPGNTYRLISKSTIFDFDVTLNFKLVNKTTGVTGLERSFTFNMGSSKQTQAVSSTTNGVKDKLFHTGGTNIDNLDESINNPFSNINNSSSFEDIASVAEESFTTFSSLFSILPGFIWALVAGAIGVLIILRVLGR